MLGLTLYLGLYVRQESIRLWQQVDACFGVRSSSSVYSDSVCKASDTTYVTSITLYGEREHVTDLACSEVYSKRRMTIVALSRTA